MSAWTANAGIPAANDNCCKEALSPIENWPTGVNEWNRDLSTVICHRPVYLLLTFLVGKLEARPLLRKRWDAGSGRLCADECAGRVDIGANHKSLFLKVCRVDHCWERLSGNVPWSRKSKCIQRLALEGPARADHDDEEKT